MIGLRELCRLAFVQVDAMALPGDGDWWQLSVEVPRTACQLDFVLSDSEERSWDNNGQKDFHSSVAGALHGTALEEHLAGLLKASLCAHINSLPV